LSRRPLPFTYYSTFVPSRDDTLDGERCGETLRSLFENAVDPNKIVVGLVEQNAPEDKFCLEQYCSHFGVNTNKRQNVREGVVKIMTNDKARESCPYYNQVRLVAYHHIQAKGPTLARSMARKVIGNEEFCMQIDAHTDFVRGWDELAVTEWKKTENEFGILSNVPADKAAKDSYTEGAEKFAEVPRQCVVRFLDNGFPVSVPSNDVFIVLHSSRPLSSPQSTASRSMCY
jgi:Glycosyltransferase (GlcNAc)